MATFQYVFYSVSHRERNIGDDSYDIYWEERFGLRYLGSEPIKYISVRISFINQVGDGFFSITKKETGPIEQEEIRLFSIDDYKKDSLYKRKTDEGNRCVRKIVSAEVEFMNGKKKDIPLTEFQECDPKGKEKWWRPQKSTGCYVATCVYGSYDCPEVWTLRRYRDNTLGATWYGRLFIRVYYAISPTLVEWFGETKWFKKLWRGKLDRMVKNLQEKGVESTPYEDKNW